MRVYNYIPKCFALKSMRERRSKISRLSRLNDPFEMFVYNLAHPFQRVAVSETLRGMDLIAGLMCFSKTWTHPVMWAHYADQHRGLCLGFDVPDSLPKQITYVEERQPFPDLENLSEAEKLDAMTRMFYTKFVGWQYEEEFRVSVRLDWHTLTDGMFFKEWDDDLKLAQVIVGKDSPTCKRELEQALDGYTEPVEFMRAEAAYDKFAVRQDPYELRNHDELIYFVWRDGIRHPVRFHRD